MTSEGGSGGLIGHSAGGQFLSLLAFTPTEAQRIVIANPGTHSCPTRRLRRPMGSRVSMRGMPWLRSCDAILVYRSPSSLGHDDTDEEGLSTSPEAKAQGQTRHERGRNAYKTAEAPSAGA